MTHCGLGSMMLELKAMYMTGEENKCNPAMHLENAIRTMAENGMTETRSNRSQEHLDLKFLTLRRLKNTAVRATILARLLCLAKRPRTSTQLKSICVDKAILSE